MDYFANLRPNRLSAGLFRASHFGFRILHSHAAQTSFLIHFLSSIRSGKFR
jgi:hypothetical protein